MKQLNLENKCTYIFSPRENPQSYYMTVIRAILPITHEVGDNVHENILINTRQTLWEMQCSK